MKKVKKIDLGAYAFMFPGSLIYLSVIIFPVFYSFYISMFEWNGIGQMKFVGLENYVKLVTTDQVFPIAIKNNLIWIVLTVVFTTGVALIFAVLLNRPFHGRTFFVDFIIFLLLLRRSQWVLLGGGSMNPTLDLLINFLKQ